MRRNLLSGLRAMGVVLFAAAFLVLSSGQLAMGAQNSSATTASTSQALVPQLIKFSGTLTDLAGKPISGPVDVTFSLYSQESGGTPLWYESQTVNANDAGEYTTLLGAMTATGVPMDLFTSGQARWLGVAVRGLPEQPRILLVSVPYAMTSGNAEMLGGKPAADYLLASQSGTSSTTTTTTVVGTTSTSTTSGRTAKQTSTASPQGITTGPTANYIAGWESDGTTLGASNIFQDPTTNNIGIGTNSPLASTQIAGSLSTSAPATVLDLSRAYNAGIAYMSAASFLLSNPKVGTNNSRLDIALQNASRAYDLLPDTTVMSLVSNGNVGIGTTNPLAKTEVMGTPSTSTPSVVLDLSRGYNPGIAYTSAASFLLSNPHVGTNNSRLDIALQNANRAYDLLPDTTVMSLVSNGNVGIGTATPASKLDVAGDVNVTVGSAGTAGTFSGGVTGISATGSAVGLHGIGSTGIQGNGGSYGVYGIGPYGVFGVGSSSGAGVYGTASGTGSGVYGTTSGTSAGVYGAATGSGYGVYGTGGVDAGYFDGNVQVTKSLASGINTVAFSATPTFDCSLGNIQTITLTGNVTSSTLANCTAGEILVFDIVEDATGGHTFTWPSNVHQGGAITTTANEHNRQMFYSDGTNLWSVGPMQPGT